MERVSRLQSLMKQRNVKQVVVYEHHNIYYLTGIKIIPSLFLQALIVNQEGKAILIYHAVQRYEGRLDTSLYNVEFISYSQYTDPNSFILGYIDSEATFDPSFPIGPYTYFVDHNKDNYYGVDKLVAELRSQKDEYELACMRYANKISDEAMLYAKSLLVPGVKEKEVAKKVIEFIKSKECSISFIPYIMFDESTRVNQGSGDRVFKDDSYAMLDIGAKYNDYCGDTTRMYFHKCHINSEVYKTYLLMVEANKRAIKVIKAGATFETVDRASRSVLVENKIFDSSVFPTGHSIGLAIHELEYVSSINHNKLKIGMTFTLELGSYFFDKFGARVEDSIIVLENGCEVMNHTSKEDIFLD